MWMDDDQAQPDQPVGFATPSAPPLGDYASATLTMIDDAVPLPQGFTVTGDPGPRLDQIAPSPPEVRDARQPFEAGQGDLMPAEVQRDPRKPIETASFAGNSTSTDFAPPTGQPVVPDLKWAPPTGQPAPPWGGLLGASGQSSQPLVPYGPHSTVGSIARPGYPGAAPVWGPPPGAYPQGAYAPPPGRYVLKPTVGMPPPYGGNAGEAPLRRRYAAARDGFAKFGVVLQAVSWPALLILAVGLLPIGSWSMVLMLIAMLVCTSNAKVAKSALGRCFLAAAIVYTITWITSGAVNTYLATQVYDALLRIYCAILIVVLPLIVWRDLERH